MKAPRTRIDEGATDFERDLLRSWGREQPSDGARQATLALVAGAAALGASTTASTAAAAGLKAATSSIAPKVGTLGAGALAKWVLVGAGVVALAAGGAAVEVARSSSRGTQATVVEVGAAAPAAPPVASVAAPAPRPQPQASAVTATATETAAPMATPMATATSAPALRPVPAPVPPTTPTTPPAAQTTPVAPEPRAPALALGQQVAALDRAREALAAGNAAGALRQLDEYDREFPRGVLAQEATAVRIDALAQQGNLDAAARLAERFLAANPRSPNAARLRLLVQRAHNP